LREIPQPEVGNSRFLWRALGLVCGWLARKLTFYLFTMKAVNLPLKHWKPPWGPHGVITQKAMF